MLPYVVVVVPFSDTGKPRGLEHHTFFSREGDLQKDRVIALVLVAFGSRSTKGVTAYSSTAVVMTLL